MKLIRKLLILSALVFGVTACGEKTPDPIWATKVEAVGQKSITIEENATATLEVKVTPANYNYGSISWSGGTSYGETYVSIVPNGLKATITGVKATSNVQIYASINGKDGEVREIFDIQVIPKIVKIMAIIPDALTCTVSPGSSQQIGFNVAPESYNEVVMSTAFDSDNNPTTKIAGFITNKKVTVNAVPSAPAGEYTIILFAAPDRNTDYVETMVHAAIKVTVMSSAS